MSQLPEGSSPDRPGSDLAPSVPDEPPGLVARASSGGALISLTPAQRRHLVVKELLGTEESYVLGLATLIKDFITPLCFTEGLATFNAHQAFLSQSSTPSTSSSSSSSSSSSPTPTSSTSSASSSSGSAPPPVPTRIRFPSFSRMITAVEDISLIHGEWFGELQTRLASWTEETLVADVLCKLIPKLKSYVMFINNFSGAMKELTEFRKKNKKFDEFVHALRSTGANKTIFGPTGLATLLITPIQRVPRYCLLFNDLLKHTDASHPDFEAITNAVKEVEQMTSHLDQEKEREEQNRRLQSLIKNLEGDLSHLRQSVMQLRQSQLHVVSRQRKAHAWKAKEFHSPRWCCFCHGAIIDPATGKFLGYHCKSCNVSSHKNCLPKVPPVCGTFDDGDLGGERTLLLESERPVTYEAVLALDRSGKAKKPLSCTLMLFDDALLCLEPKGSSSRNRHNLVCMIKWFSRLTNRHVESMPSSTGPALSILPPREMDVLHVFTFSSFEERDMWHSAIKESIALYKSMHGIETHSAIPASAASGAMGTMRRQGSAARSQLKTAFTKR